MSIVLLSAISQGLLLANLCLAFALVYWSTRIFFVAAGGIFALCPLMVAHLAPSSGLTAAVTLGLTASALVSLLAGWLNHEALLRNNATLGVHFTSSLAIYFVLAELLSWSFGSDPLSLAGLVSLFRLPAGFSVSIPGTQLLAILGSLAVNLAAYSLLHLTRHGLHLRALADNPAELARCGIDPRVLRAWAFGGAGVLVALSGLLVSVDLSVGSHSGMTALIPAITVTLLTEPGRWSRLWAGALLIAFFRVTITFFLSGIWQDALTSALLLAALLWQRTNLRFPGLAWQGSRS